MGDSQLQLVLDSRWLKRPQHKNIWRAVRRSAKLFSRSRAMRKLRADQMSRLCAPSRSTLQRVTKPSYGSSCVHRLLVGFDRKQVTITYHRGLVIARSWSPDSPPCRPPSGTRRRHVSYSRTSVDP